MAARRRSDNGPAGEARRLTRAYLSMAYRIAEPAVETSDFRGGYEVWACALRLVLGTVRGAKDLKGALAEALETAEELRSPEERAGALRATVEPFLDEESAPVRITANRDEPLRYIRQHIELAVQIGAPAYNLGDQRGCYEVYACMARLMVRAQGADEAKGRLQRALLQCETLSDPNEQAWAMRHGMDDVLSGAFGTPVAAGEQVRDYLAGAIRIGTPAYESGDQRGCYEVYACTARLILHTVEGEEAAKQVLRAGLAECAAENDVSRMAGILARAFDRVVEGTASSKEQP